MARHKSEEAALRRRVGAEIARRRVAGRKKPADLAAVAGIDDSQMSKVLAGRAGLSLYSLGRVAAALGCTASEILAGAEQDPAPKSRRVVPRRAAAREFHRST
jgi:transcriptional regulator with XRE-family HTH domain